MYEQHGNFYKMPDVGGIHKVRTGMEWGKRWMIDFLMRLVAEWNKDIYWQFDIGDNYADIPLGDISVKGGSPPRWKVAKVGGHVSHRCGIDVDIYSIAKDGMPSQRIAYGMPNYDLARTKELGRLIIKHGKADLEKILLGGDKLAEYLTAEAEKESIAHVIDNDKSGMHHNHFHIRLINRDADKSC